ncbi:MAG: prepilin peptidase [Candidatus Riflebacteria bacterium]|nr:prepilin peptidase [Candidatus Riflebacteria bacterium]
MEGLGETIGLLFEVFLKAPPLFHAAVIAMFAGLTGSFINVCIWRIPRRESIVFPRSRCTSCGHVLDPIDLIPILTWLVTRGHCRHCGAPVSSRYVVVEAINVTLWLSAYLALGMTGRFFWTGVGLSTILAVTGISLMSREIKRRERAGFTFISIMLTALVLAISIGPFLDLTRTGFVGATKNQEYVKAYALAMERIEEIRGIPPANLHSDRKIYIETERLSDNIFADEVLGQYAEMRESPKVFAEKFTDIYTDQRKLPDPVMERFKRDFKRYYGFEYELYPQGYEVFRRITTVDEVKDKYDPGRTIRKVKVTVEINSKVTKGRKIELESLMSEG